MQHLGSRITLAALLFLTAGAVSAQEPSTAEQVIDVMGKLFGSHPGYRANHAKGILVEGTFSPTPEAASLSKASIFQGSAVPVTARFSDATGVPSIPDGSKDANPHGLALKFKLPDGGDMDVVVIALKTFPVATGEEFRDLLTAVSKSGPDAPKPTPLDTFVAAHPSVPQAFGSTGTPASFAQQRFNGLNAFIFVDKDGKRQPFRFIVEPEAGEKLLTPEDAAKQAPDFLMNEIAERIGKGPVVYKVKAQLAAEGDPTADATKAWPDDRKVVTLGTLTLNKLVPDSKDAEKRLLFMPNALTDGIEVSDDPLIDTRVEAYAISFSRRSQ